MIFPKGAPRKAKIANLDVEALVQQQIGTLEIPVQDREWLMAVQIIHSTRYALRHLRMVYFRIIILLRLQNAKPALTSRAF